MFGFKGPWFGPAAAQSMFRFQGLLGFRGFGALRV